MHQPSLWYHSSAVLALALDALTLPYRMRNNSTPMYQVAETLAVSGRKVGVEIFVTSMSQEALMSQ